MTYATQIGERVYEFEHMSDVNTARDIHVHCKGDQNHFETEMEQGGIDFTVEQDCFLSEHSVAELIYS